MFLSLCETNSWIILAGENLKFPLWFHFKAARIQNISFLKTRGKYVRMMTRLTRLTFYYYINIKMKLLRILTNLGFGYETILFCRRRWVFVAHSWAVFGFVILSVSITLISLIVIWDQIKQMQRKTETLDFVLFGPKRDVSGLSI